MPGRWLGREKGWLVDRWVRTADDVLVMLDGWFSREVSWDDFYADRSRPVPFFVPKPDENLVAHVESGRISPGRALDVGCGPGRNAIWLASAGFDVDAVDLSPRALEWARERAAQIGAQVRFHCGDLFSVPLPAGQYDLVYDHGCLHHLPPHRRVSYRALVNRVLRPGGHLGLACFAAGHMGSELPDEQLYRDGTLHRGLAFTPAELRAIFADLTEVELRPMRAQPADAPAFGETFLLTALFRLPGSTHARPAPA